MSQPHEVPYRSLYSDTDPEAERVQLEIYRGMTSSRKLQLVDDAIHMTRELMLAGLRSRFPMAGTEEIRRRFFGLWLGEELATEVYGPLDERR
jgi:hypothetical protein